MFYVILFIYDDSSDINWLTVIGNFFKCIIMNLLIYFDQNFSYESNLPHCGRVMHM